MDTSAGSFHDEEAGDFAETFQLPKTTGEEDEDMVETGLFKPEVCTVHVNDAPTMEDNQTNEAGIEDFLASVSEHREQAPHYSGDVVSIEDYEEELNRTPFKVIDEHYGGGHKGPRIWGHYFRISHSLACRRCCNRNCANIDHPKGIPIQPCMHPHAKYHLSEEKLIREIIKKELEPWRRVPSSAFYTMSFRLPQHFTLCLI